MTFVIIIMILGIILSIVITTMTVMFIIDFIVNIVCSLPQLSDYQLGEFLPRIFLLMRL